MTELNTLKRKSPADLWKEDLAAFSEELEVSWNQASCTFDIRNLWCSFHLSPFQICEVKEKENAAMPVKKVAGKGKTVKVKQETLPTPQGRRVIPRVTSTMKAEANRKADIKKGEGKRGRKIKVRLWFFPSFHDFVIFESGRKFNLMWPV